MIIVVILGRMLNSRSDALNSIGLAAIILCINPLSAGDIGLLWSFVTTISIVLFAKGINDYLIDKINIKTAVGKRFSALFSTSVSAFIGSLPFVVLVTGTLSPYTVIVNILTVPFAGLIIVCGGFGALLFILHLNVLAYPLMYICGLVTKYIVFAVNVCSRLPNAFVSTEKAAVYVWFTVCAVISAVLFLFDRKSRYIRIGACAMAAALLAVYSVDYAINADKVVLSVLDVGEGMTVTLKKGGSVVVINSYGEKYQFPTIQEELSGFGSVDCLIDTASGGEEYNYSRKILSRFDVNNVLLYDSKKFDTEYGYARYKGVNVTQIADDYTLNVYDGVKLRFIAGDGDVWCRCSIYGREILICPQGADVGALPEDCRSSDIVILSDIPESCEMLGDSYFVLSGYGDTADEYESALQKMGETPALTGGMGRIDFEFDANGGTAVDREYTGGVIRWQ